MTGAERRAEAYAAKFRAAGFVRVTVMLTHPDVPTYSDGRPMHKAYTLAHLHAWHDDPHLYVYAGFQSFDDTPGRSRVASMEMTDMLPGGQTQRITVKRLNQICTGTAS